MKSGLKIVCVMIWSLCTKAQNTSYLWPIDSPYVLTANYGELRPNHFHAGLDFATGGQINKPVYSVEDGYISRIKVSSVGYGKCVYVTHPNNKVTVYAHLNSFGLKADVLVKQEQLTQQNYEVEVIPKPFSVLVRKHEILGLSGNTGGSTGPHLHFEIRDEKSETPLNPLLFYKINDQVSPQVQAIALYSLADTTVPKLSRVFPVHAGYGDTCALHESSITLNESIVGLAFAGFDKVQPGGSPNNIYAVKLWYDDFLIYSHQLNQIDFSETRYINEYSESYGGYRFQKCFLPTLYPNKFLHKEFNKGRLVLRDNDFHKMRFQFSDESGHHTYLQFYLRTAEVTYYKESSIKSNDYLNCRKDYFVRKDGLHLFVPANSLYYSTPLIFENTLEGSGKLIILPSEINLRNPVMVGFKTPAAHRQHKQKLVLKSGNTVYPAIVKNDSVYFAVKNFGWFQLSADSAKPIIKPLLTARKIKKLRRPLSFSFIISDQSSGIGRYKSFVNKVYVPAEYDAKSDLLTFYFDEETPVGPKALRVEVEDKAGNRAVYELTLPN